MWKLCESCCGTSATEEGKELREVRSVGAGGSEGAEGAEAQLLSWDWESMAAAGMYNLPRPLQQGDSFTVTGKTAGGARQYILNLITEQAGRRGTAFQLKASYDRRVIELRHEENGTLSAPELLTQFLQNDSNSKERAFSYKFTVLYPSTVTIESDGSYMHEFTLKHPAAAMRALQVSGDVQRLISLEFQFGT